MSKQILKMKYGKRFYLILREDQIKAGYVHSKHIPNRQKRLRITVKAWAKFDIEKQIWLCKIYHVILTDYRTKREKLKYVLDEYPKKIDKGLKIFDKYMKKFDEGMKQFNDGMKGFDKLGASDKAIDKFLKDNRKK